MKLKEIAQFANGELSGDGEIELSGVSELLTAKLTDLAFVLDVQHIPEISKSNASAFVIFKDLKFETSKPYILIGNPHLTFAKILTLFLNQDKFSPEIHSTAVLGKNVKFGKDVFIGAHSVIEDEVVIGDYTCIMSLSYVGRRVKIGKNSIIYPNVSVLRDIVIGNNVIIHSGTVIGSDGFGYAKDEVGKYNKIPQIGSVIIEDDVEIGSNVSIDRATLGKTLIKKAQKIDNLVQVAHNVIIGENVILAGQAGISGSVTVGNNVIIAGQVGIADHVNIKDNIIIAAQTGVSKDLEPNKIYFGTPAKEMGEAKRSLAEVSRLPKLYQKVKDLEKISELSKDNKTSN